MRKRLILLLTLALLLPSALPALAAGAATAQVSDDRPRLNFPESITFQARFESETPITGLTLEYGSDQLTCGEVIAVAFPQFDPGTSVQASWTWEMRQSGSLPPGATIWWRWRVTEQSGAETLTERQTVTWLDSLHAWQTISGGNVNLHWYQNERSFAEDLHTTAIAALTRLQQDLGVPAESPVDLYIYANQSDMQEAILYEPGWSGGVAFAEHDIILLGITPADIEWGKDSIAHELAHVLVGHLTFTCLGGLPTWLAEGLAVYAEGELDAASARQLEQAIAEDTLLSVRSLSGGFSEVPSRAYLSYSQSYSLVKFLIETYGRDSMTDLLLALRDGHPIDPALQAVYGFDIEGLEDAWRTAINARPRVVGAAPTPTALPTPVPTFVPVSGAPLAVNPTPFAAPARPTATVRADRPAVTPDTGAPRLTFSMLVLALCCCTGTILVGVALLVFFLERRNRRLK